MTESTQSPRGTLYIFAAPSGAGKTSLLKALVENTDWIEVSVSHTTRASRSGEVEGHDYHFIDVARFEQMVAKGAFLEHARVFDNYYGTTRAGIEQRLEDGIDVVLEIDWQGARQVRQVFSESVGIFILPPSRQALQDRLRARAQDDEDIIARRMQDAQSEMSHYAEFDYLVINDDFSRALKDLQAIITVQRLRTVRQGALHAEALSGLLA